MIAEVGAPVASRAMPARRVAGLTGPEWAVVFVAVCTASLPAVMPAMVAAMASQPGIGTAGAGYLVSANMAGLFVGTLLCAVLGARFAHRDLIVGGLLVMVAGNLLTIAAPSYSLLVACRVVSGVGEGAAAAICYSLMAGGTRPATALAFYVGGQGLTGAIGMAVLPWLVAAFEWQVFYVAMSVVAVPALLLAGVATREAGAPTARASRAEPISAAGWAMLGIIFVYFVGMALIWAFTQRIGELRGFDRTMVSAALSTSALVGLAGSLMVGFGADRLSPGAATLVGAALLLVVVAGFVAGAPAAFVAATWALNFAWGFQYPFLFRQLAATDPGRGASITPTATGIALTAGPALGGLLLTRAGIDATCLAFLALTGGALGAAYLRRGASGGHAR